MNRPSIKLCLTILMACIHVISSAQLNLDISTGHSWTEHELEKSDLRNFDFNTFSGKIKSNSSIVGIGLEFSSAKYTSNQNFLDQFWELETEFISTRENWRSSFLFLGPNFKIGSGKLNFEIFPKLGIGFIKAPDRLLKLNTDQGEQTLYEDISSQKGLNENGLFSGLDLQLNYQITNRFAFHINGGIKTNRFFGEGNAVIYRKTEGLSDEQIAQSSLIQLDCDAYELFTIGAGIGINLFGTNPDKPDEENSSLLPPQPVFPENNSSVSFAALDSLVFEWKREAPNVKFANYVFQLFQKGVNGESDSLIHAEKIEKKTEFKLPAALDLQIGDRYLWRVQAVDHKDLKACASNCESVQFEFEVVTTAVPQFYVLSKEDAGNYIEIGGFVRFELKNTLSTSSNVSLKIINEKNEAVFAIDDLSTNSKGVTYFGKDRIELDVRELPANQYYLLQVKGKNRTYFLRFTIPSANEEQKD